MSDSQEIDFMLFNGDVKKDYFFPSFFQLYWGITDQHMTNLVCTEYTLNQTRRKMQSENALITASSHPLFPARYSMSIIYSWGQGQFALT